MSARSSRLARRARSAGSVTVSGIWASYLAMRAAQAAALRPSSFVPRAARVSPPSLPARAWWSAMGHRFEDSIYGPADLLGDRGGFGQADVVFAVSESPERLSGEAEAFAEFVDGVDVEASSGAVDGGGGDAEA